MNRAASGATGLAFFEDHRIFPGLWSAMRAGLHTRLMLHPLAAEAHTLQRVFCERESEARGACRLRRRANGGGQSGARRHSRRSDAAGASPGSRKLSWQSSCQRVLVRSAGSSLQRVRPYPVTTDCLAARFVVLAQFGQGRRAIFVQERSPRHRGGQFTMGAYRRQLGATQPSCSISASAHARIHACCC